MKQVFCHWTIKADTKGSHIAILVPFRTTKDSFLPITFTGLADLYYLHRNSFVGILFIWLWWSNIKIPTTGAGVLGSNPGCAF